MTATSPYLDQPKRDLEDVQAARERDQYERRDKLHRMALDDLIGWLEAPPRHREAVRYALRKLNETAAARILERNKDGT